MLHIVSNPPKTLDSSFRLIGDKKTEKEQGRETVLFVNEGVIF